MSKLKYLALLPFLLWGAMANAQHGGDLQAQIVYAYQTEDLNRLEDLVQGLREQINTEGSNASLRSGARAVSAGPVVCPKSLPRRAVRLCRLHRRP
jgi:hypothetical protein